MRGDYKKGMKFYKYEYGLTFGHFYCWNMNEAIKKTIKIMGHIDEDDSSYYYCNGFQISEISKEDYNSHVSKFANGSELIIK